MRAVLVAWLLRHALPAWLAPDYVVLVGVAGLLGAWAALRLAEKDRAFVPYQARALALGYIAALLGGYVFEALRALPAAIAERSWMPILGAGRAAYGGLIFGVAVPAIYLHLKKQPIAPFLDRLTPLLGITFAFVRVGCFLAGCDYGRPTASALGLRFPAGSPAALDHADLGWVRLGAPSLPVHATQLYEAAVGVIATVIAYRILRRGARDGRAFAAWLATYAVGRFAVELLRGDDARGLYAGLSTAQYVSLVIVALLIAWIRGLDRRFARPAAALALLLALPAARPAEGAPKAGAKTPKPPASASASASASAPPEPAPPPAPSASAVASAAPAVPPPPEPARRYVSLRLAVAPALVFGNPDVPSGGVIELGASYRVPISRAVRFEVGLEPRLFRNIEASHLSLGVPLEMVFGVSRRVELTTELTLHHTWILFDSPFFPPTNAWGARFAFGMQFPLRNRGFLGFTPLAGNVLSAQSIGVVTTWEPRFWGGVAL